MKNQNITTKLAVLGAVGCMTLVSAQANPVNLQLGLGTTSDVLGQVVPPVIGGAGGQEADDQTMANQLISMYLNGPSSTSVGGSAYTISGNTFGDITSGTTASTTGDMLFAGSPQGEYFTVQLPQNVGYHFLTVRYDGSNSGVEVWDISSLAPGTTIEVPTYGEINVNGVLVNGWGGSDQNSKYQVTDWTLFDQTQGVPDGGSTLVLLGIAGLGLFAFVRKTQTT